MLATRPLLASGQPLDPSPEAFGFVRSSADALADPAELNRRLEDDGYLYLPGFFDSDLILAARRAVTDRLAAEGSLDPAAPTMEAVARPDRAFSYRGDLARDNAAVSRVVYGPELLGFYQRLFGEPVRHYDHTWFRAVSHGQGTPPHCDLVYMGRGTHQLLTAWIPYGDIPLEMGGVMLLEGSHRQTERLRSYLAWDVDAYCENRPAQVERVRVDPRQARRPLADLARVARRRPPHLRHDDRARRARQPDAPLPVFVRHALPARQPADRRALGRRESDRQHARGQARPSLLARRCRAADGAGSRESLSAIDLRSPARPRHLT